MERTMSIKEDSRIIIKHEWLQVLVMAVTVAGLFLWNHSEMHSNQRENRALIEAINKEMKDFHGRLCSIEERNRK